MITDNANVRKSGRTPPQQVNGAGIRVRAFKHFDRLQQWFLIEIGLNRFETQGSQK